MSKIIFVRHGETDKNIDGILHVHGDTEPLTQKGVQQMEKTAEKLKEYAPTHVICSTETRAIDSGKIIAERLQLPLEQRDDLQERDWGVFSGRRWAEAEPILDAMPFEKRYTYKPQGGESWQEFETRLRDALLHLMETYPDQTVVVVTHEGAIRALTPFLLDIPREGSYDHRFDNGSITIVTDENGRSSVTAVNNTAHL